MILSINIFDLGKFDSLRESNEYLREITEFINGMCHIKGEDYSELERILIKNRIRYKIK